MENKDYKLNFMCGSYLIDPKMVNFTGNSYFYRNKLFKTKVDQMLYPKKSKQDIPKPN